MSWIQKLYDTYENCQSMIGSETDENLVPLLPICHTTQKAHIEITIDGEGNFKTARVVPKNEARTIIPCTESSGGRTSGPVAHPLCDKLQYVANDYAKHGGSKGSYFELYAAELERWCSSSFSHPKAIAVLKYIKRGNVIGDLINHHVLLAGKDGKLLPKPEKKNREKEDVLDIFDVLNSQDDSFVRWEVEVPGDPKTKVWKDNSLWQSWINYYSRTKEDKTLCYVTGEERLSADQHPAKLRNDGDKAKLISFNDLSGFTFRGRFLRADQAAGVGFEVTQKAHNALRWLISRQSYRKGKDGQAIVAWATSGKSIPAPTADALSILGFDELPSDESITSSTAQELALKLRRKIAGYGAQLGNITGVVIMGLDSATLGRMAITFYRELSSSDFLKRIEQWHETCTWIHTYGYNPDTKKHYQFVGAPAPSDIAEAAYGPWVDDNLRKTTVERILPCIIDGQQVPRDIVESAVRHASNKIGIKKWKLSKPTSSRDSPDASNKIGIKNWKWEKILSIACALYKKLNERKEDYDMALDPNRKTRDYLYGRLLAIADRLEGHALYKAKEERDTNAARYMQQFAERPNKTWRQIELSLSPYIARLGGAFFYKSLIDEVTCKFDIEDFNSDKPLSGEFLLGYHCQRAALWQKDGAVPSNQAESDNN